MNAIDTTCKVSRQIEKIAILLLKEVLVLFSDFMNATREVEMLGLTESLTQFHE
jgi:hypothetical protein